MALGFGEEADGQGNPIWKWVKNGSDIEAFRLWHMAMGMITYVMMMPSGGRTFF